MTNENLTNQSPFSNGIVVDDGSIKEVIRNKVGEVIGELVFRPGDLNLIDRYNAVIDDFDSITAPLEHIDINPDGTAKDGDDAAIKALSESRERLFAALNSVLDADISGAFFSRTNPFSAVNGRFYCEGVIDVLGRYIEYHLGKETKKLNKRVNKYTHGYAARTGKHKNGKR